MSSDKVKESLVVIDKSHKSPDDDVLLREASEKALAALLSLHESVHWFCISNRVSIPNLDLVTTHALLQFAFSETRTTCGRVFEDLLAKKLGQCHQCIDGYYATKKRVQQILLDVYQYSTENIESFLNIILEWDIDRLSVALETANVLVVTEKNPITVKGVYCPLFECLIAPECLITNLKAHDLFGTLFTAIERYAGRVKYNTPGTGISGLVVLLFDDSPTYYRPNEWARSQFERRLPLTLSEYSGQTQAYFARIVENYVQGHVSEQVFWIGLSTLLSCSNHDVVVHGICGEDQDIIALLIPVLMSAYVKHVCICLNVIIKSLGQNFWQRIQPLSFKYIIDTLFDNFNYMQSLVTCQGERDIDNLRSLTNWMVPAVASQTGHGVIKALSYLLRKINNLQVDKTLYDFWLFRKLELIEIGIDISITYVKTLTADAFVAYMMEVEEVTKFLPQELLTNQNSMYDKILRLLISIECSLYVMLSAEGKGHDGIKMPSLTWAWDYLTQCRMTSSILLNFFIGISPLIFQPRHLWTPLFDKIKSVELKIQQLDSQVLQETITDEKCCMIVLSWMMHSDDEVQLIISDLLKLAFDTIGRTDSLQELFTKYPKSAIKGFTSMLEGVIHHMHGRSKEEGSALFLKTCSHIIEASSALVPIIYSSMKDNSDSLQTKLQIYGNFWRLEWRLINLIFVFVIDESSSPHINKKFIIEFMRDTLELSDILLDELSFIELPIVTTNNLIDVEKCLSSKSHYISRLLKPLRNICRWFSFNDSQAPGLVKNVYDLTLRLLNLILEYKLDAGSEVYGLYEKIATNSKYQLTSAMREELLLLLSRCMDNPEFEVEDFAISKIDTDICQKEKYDVKRPTGPLKTNRYAELRKSNLEGKPKAKSNTLLGQIKSEIVEHRGKLATKPPMKGKNGKKFASSTYGQLVLTDSHTEKSLEGASDSSGSSSENEADDHGLFNLQKDHKSPKFKKVERRSVKLINAALGVDITIKRQRLEAQRLVKARRYPSLEPFHRVILSWNPLKKEEDLVEFTGLERIPPIFNSIIQYQKTMGALHYLETWHNVEHSKQERSDDPTFKFTIGSRSTVDGFVDMTCTMVKDKFEVVTFSETDLLVVAKSPPTKTDPEVACYAKVHSFSKRGLEVEVVLRCIPDTIMSEALRPHATFFACKVVNLTTMNREYAALQSLPFIDLGNAILSAHASLRFPSPKDRITKIMTNYHINEPQAEAVFGATQKEGITLVQGPPGTGKTKAILGMVGFLLSDLHLASSNVISIPGSLKSIRNTQKKILLCAPSNAAVDEIVQRLGHGIYNNEGGVFYPKIIRLGVSDSVNVNTRKWTLEELVEQELSCMNARINSEKLQELRLHHTRIVMERDHVRSLLHKAREEGSENISQLEADFEKLNGERLRIGRELDDEREKQKQSFRSYDIEKRRLIMAKMEEAQVICCTLSGSGHDILVNLEVDFETVIIDEASQAVELSTLIPLKYGCKRFILVGDPNQLPPTVLSQKATDLGFNESLFVRVQARSPESVYLLSIQYRMRPEISLFPSRVFYNSQLVDGPGILESTNRAWHMTPYLMPYQFINLTDSRESRSMKGHSVYNKSEVDAVFTLYQQLTTSFNTHSFEGQIGIITPYKDQLRLLKRVFTSHYGQLIYDAVDFNTIDGFQGQEKDIIIFSCVRGSLNGGGVGFISDFRRMNVALTRGKLTRYEIYFIDAKARSTLIVLGNAKHLESNSFWRKLIQDAKSRGVFTDATLKDLQSHAQLKTPRQQLLIVDGENLPPTEFPRKRTRSVVEEPVAVKQSRLANGKRIAAQGDRFHVQETKPEPDLLAVSQLFSRPSSTSNNLPVNDERLLMPSSTGAPQTVDNIQNQNQENNSSTNPSGSSTKSKKIAIKNRNGASSLFIPRRKP